ncbi:MAG: YdjY domain-containing protein [Planctomycetota bacterium]|jgi:CubicO group peptidase (beta-lactamase class C family)
MRGLAVVLALAACAAVSRAQDGDSGVHRLGGVEPPDPAALRADPAAFEDLLAEQGLALDLEAGTVSARGGTLHDAESLRYPIEYLMVTDRGQTHESLFVVKAQPSVLDACFRALGLEPGHPMRWVMKDPQPSAEALEAGEDVPWEASPADGPLIEVEAVWTDDDGRHHRQSLESMLIDVRDGEPVEQLDWVYTGSGVGPLRQGRSVVQTFMADLQGNIIATWLTGMGAALLERNSLEGVDDTLYTINPDTAPARKTPVTIVFRDSKREAPIAPPPSGVTVVQGEEGERLDAWLTRATEAGFNGVVLAARGDDILLHKGYGFADRERGVPMSTRTVFPIEELSRVFRETAIHQLEEQELLRRTDRFARHLDDVPEDKAIISISHLLEGTSGLPSVPRDAPQRIDLDAAVADALAAQLAFMTPGERGGGSLLDGTLVVGVIENAASMSWGNYLAENVFGPTDMTDSGLQGEPRWAGSQLASLHYDGKKTRSPATSPMLWPRSGIGAMVSSVRDLFRWDRAVRSGAVIGLGLVDRRDSGWGGSAGGGHRLGSTIQIWAKGDQWVGLATNTMPSPFSAWELGKVLAGEDVPLPTR